MWNQLLTPHNVFVFLVLVVFSAGWLIGILPTSIAVPLIASLGSVGVGASVLSTGVSIGVPLQTTEETTSPKNTPLQGERIAA